MREFGESPFEKFPAFYVQVSEVVWTRTRKRAWQYFHGFPCNSRPPRIGLGGVFAERDRSVKQCPECASAHMLAVQGIFLEFEEAVRSGEDVDPVTFARKYAVRRWQDAVRINDGADFNSLQRPKRTIEESAWIVGALEADEYLIAVGVLILWFTQGHDAPEPGHEFPYVRFADQLVGKGWETTPSQVAKDVAEVLQRLDE